MSGKSIVRSEKKGKGGRPQVLSNADKRYCVRLVTRNCMDNAVKVRQELKRELSVNASVHTIRRTFRGAGLGAIEKQKNWSLAQPMQKGDLNGAWLIVTEL